jgi:hypothetical protein
MTLGERYGRARGVESEESEPCPGEAQHLGPNAGPGSFPSLGPERPWPNAAVRTIAGGGLLGSPTNLFTVSLHVVDGSTRVVCSLRH